MTTTITINYTDPLKNAITIPYNGKNTDTPLVLVGNGVMDYGQDLWGNMLHILENFSNSTAPMNPVTGQLFFKSDTKELKLFDGVDWTGIQTSALDLSGYLPITGGILSGNLSLVSEFTNSNALKPGIPDNRAVTKKYVDYVVSLVATPSSAVIVDAVTTNANSLPFINSSATNVAYRTMTKPLVLLSENYIADGSLHSSETPTPYSSQLYAATRKYVDARVASVVPGKADAITPSNLVAEIKKLPYTDLPFLYRDILPADMTAKAAAITMSSNIILPDYTTGTSAVVSDASYAAPRKYVDDSIFTAKQLITNDLAELIRTNQSNALRTGIINPVDVKVTQSTYAIIGDHIIANGAVQCLQMVKPSAVIDDDRVYYTATVVISDILPGDVKLKNAKYSVVAGFIDDMVPYSTNLPFSTNFLITRTASRFTITLLVSPSPAALANAYIPTEFTFTITGIKQ